jgi:hypothetical protein
MPPGGGTAIPNDVLVGSNIFIVLPAESVGLKKGNWLVYWV